MIVEIRGLNYESLAFVASSKPWKTGRLFCNEKCFINRSRIDKKSRGIAMTQATVLPYIGTFRGAVRNHSPQANGYSVEVRPWATPTLRTWTLGF